MISASVQNLLGFLFFGVLLAIAITGSTIRIEFRVVPGFSTACPGVFMSRADAAATRINSLGFALR